MLCVAVDHVGEVEVWHHSHWDGVASLRGYRHPGYRLT